MDDDKIRLMIQGVFGPNVGVGITDPRDDHHVLLGPEQDAMSRAIPNRRREFAAGRAAGRKALAEVGFPAVAIPAAADRSPTWPAGIAGSISHCESLCVAVTCHVQTWRSIGIDIEGKTPLEKEAWPIVMTPQEQTALQSVPRWRRAKQLKTLFSIKESVYKAQFPLTGQMCDFQALDVTLCDDGRFQARFTQTLGSFQPGYVAHGRYLQFDNWVLSGCMLPDR